MSKGRNDKLLGAGGLPGGPASGGMSGQSDALAQEMAKLSYEEAQRELEQIVEQIEGGSVGLEESMAAYERGVALSAHCKQLLAQAEQKFTELTARVSAGGPGGAGGAGGGAGGGGGASVGA